MNGIDPLLLDPDQIRTFLAVVDARSFGRAAIVLGVRQPAVSQQLRRLETTLGRTVFRRSASGAELTTDGEALLIYVRAMVELTDTMKQHFSGGGAKLRLRLGLSEDFSRTAMTLVLRMFARVHSNFELRIIGGTPDAVVRSFENNELDVLVTWAQWHLRGAEVLWTDQLVWTGPSDVTAEVRGTVPLVLPPAPSPMRDLVLRVMHEHKRTWSIPFETTSLASAEAAIAAGIGYSCLPRSMPLLGPVHLDGAAGLPPLPTVDYAMVRHERAGSAAVSAFCKMLVEAARLSFRQAPARGGA